MVIIRDLPRKTSNASLFPDRPSQRRREVLGGFDDRCWVDRHGSHARAPVGTFGAFSGGKVIYSKRIMTNLFSIKQVNCVIVTDYNFFFNRTGHSWKLSKFYEQPSLMNPAKIEL